ncbi:uncharacterized protein MONBRDRAFT_27882 [Monosiga brevicollis MX1]|uniref:Uncharacterized protein n=1 Tax=Monosiga brevicollis TaxID=81824 RepID=A9V6R4_MONBE|nr:uncharacterized protein MONBRDRAFT_27882 [Monosiga brevicollis MX1]EDQ86780.1 predicted protein [Monosiga brevicollis MX1]|eukprot:XP_001748325.1 hypothetical protein [Monosiga brevicollis MX1]
MAIGASGTRGIAGVLAAILFGLALSVCGGVFNHMRGSNAGMLTPAAFAGRSCADNWCTDYWLQHLYTRAVMALPTGAVVYYTCQRPGLALVVTAAMYVTIFVGWGTYMGMGAHPDVTARTGFMDWLLGREEENWSKFRRWVRCYAGMGIRGLLWTLPAGHILHHAGYSWHIALCGAVMPALYSLDHLSHREWTSHEWQPLTCADPPFSQEWAFQLGGPLSEFLFGAWLWMCLIVGLSRFPERTKDKANLYQTIGGLSLGTLALLVSLGVQTYKRWSSPSSRGYQTIQNSDHDEDDSDDDDTAAASADLSGVAPAWFFEVTARREVKVYRFWEWTLSLATLASTVLTLGFAVTCFVWNIHTARYCPDC